MLDHAGAMLLFCSMANQLVPYLDQLEAACREHGIDLIDVCRAEGVADTTLLRWRKGEAFPREGTAKALIERITSLASERAHAEKAA